MSILVCGKSLELSGPAQGAFEGVREVDGVVEGAPAIGRALLDSTRVSCRARGDVCRASRCLDCERFVNYVPSRDRRRVTIRCYWSGADRVRDLMVSAADVLAIPSDARVADARRLAAEYDRAVVLVVDRGVLVGVARRRDLEWAPSEHVIGAHATRRAWTIGPDASLADLAGIVSGHGTDVVLVIDDGGGLLGVVTRDDLREVGWSAAGQLGSAAGCR